MEVGRLKGEERLRTLAELECVIPCEKEKCKYYRAMRYMLLMT